MTAKADNTTRTPGATKAKAAKSSPRITKREKLIMQAWKEHAEGRVSDADFFRDQRLLQTATQYLRLEDLLAMMGNGELPPPSAWGTRFFDAQFLPIAAKAIHRRDAMLKPHVEQLERLMPALLADYGVVPGNAKIIFSRLREHIDRYSGPPESGPFIAWAMEQVAATLTALHITTKVKAENDIAFADIYQRAFRSAFAGAWEVLRHCRHLGATPDTVRQIVQDCFTKIFLSAEDWRDDGTASIPTRVRAYAKAQAQGWRTQSIRERQKERRMIGAMRRYGIPVKTKRRRAAQ